MKEIINQIFEIEQKSKEIGTDKLDRNLKKIISLLEEKGYSIENPIGKNYQIQDTTIEANFIDENGKNKISKVLKPTIFIKQGDQLELIQKAIVVVS